MSQLNVGFHLVIELEKIRNSIISPSESEVKINSPVNLQNVLRRLGNILDSFSPRVWLHQWIEKNRSINGNFRKMTGELVVDGTLRIQL
jgi:hypothetical protein